jgi:hypothetical protein
VPYFSGSFSKGSERKIKCLTYDYFPQHSCTIQHPLLEVAFPSNHGSNQLSIVCYSQLPFSKAAVINKRFSLKNCGCRQWIRIGHFIHLLLPTINLAVTRHSSHTKHSPRLLPESYWCKRHNTCKGNLSKRGDLSAI